MRRAMGLSAAVAALLAVAPCAAPAAGLDADVYALHGKCMSLSVGAGAVGADGTDGYRTGGAATPFTLQATGLGTFLLEDAGGQLLGQRSGIALPARVVGPVGGPEAAGPTAEWAVRHLGDGSRFTLRSTWSGNYIGADGDGIVRVVHTAQAIALRPATGCAAFPEASVDVSGTPASSRGKGDTVRGIVDAHLHITADMRAGGDVFGGEPFDRFGVVRALGAATDAAVHGADGSLDVTGNLLRDGVPFGTHDTGGWPAFAGWPTNNTNTHEQVYYKWLERAWRGGLRLAVAQTVEDAELCRIEPRRRYSCDETTAIRGQIHRLYALRDYIDAVSGGPRRGFLRIVTSPAQARRVIRSGRLAVIIGIESSFPLDCGTTRSGAPACTTAQVDARLATYRRLGVRSMFIAHWADNGFAGAAFEGGVKGKFINAMTRLQTGRWFSQGSCPAAGQGEELVPISALEISVLSQFFPATRALAQVAPPRYTAGRHCNTQGLSAMGAHLVRQMMKDSMLIEADHISERAREAVLKITGAAHYPVVSSHTGTGGAWSAGELRALEAGGGVSSQRLAGPAALAKAIVARPGGLGSDTGGFASLPGPARLTYPFRLAGQTFSRERTGDRVFDLSVDGMAHYGLLPDLLAATARAPQGAKALRILEGSAEAYLRTWERAERR
jgi:microsomal dipeptidase-like Zn-dependent dipeptidase